MMEKFIHINHQKGSPRFVFGEAGQTLIEVLVAMGVAVTVVSAITIAILTGLNNTEAATNQNLATRYAEQAMEVVHKLRDSDWASYSVLPGNPPQSGDYCLAKDSNTLTPMNGGSCGQNIDNKFIRQVTLVANSTDCIPPTPTPPQPPAPTPTVIPTNATKATVTVSWSDNNCTDKNAFCHQVTLESCLSDYTIVPTP